MEKHLPSGAAGLILQHEIDAAEGALAAMKARRDAAVDEASRAGCAVQAAREAATLLLKHAAAGVAVSDAEIDAAGGNEPALLRRLEFRECLAASLTEEVRVLDARAISARNRAFQPVLRAAAAGRIAALDRAEAARGARCGGLDPVAELAAAKGDWSRATALLDLVKSASSLLGPRDWPAFDISTAARERQTWRSLLPTETVSTPAAPARAA
jgi:hypothetical protein